ncbi:hypothetical protein [Kribbella sp. NBC_00359]|uniref:hypothetical protein n=1 Tax=Kribbella sp. NBC_00359 TaxID=2975966 RepID=UPI002E1BD748
MNIRVLGGSLTSDSVDRGAGRSATATATAFAAAYVAGAVPTLLSGDRLTGVALSQLEVAAARLDANAGLGADQRRPAGMPNETLDIPPAVEGSSIALARRTGSGTLRAFGTNVDGHMFTVVQTAASSLVWTGWTQSGSSAVAVVGADNVAADGRTDGY